MSSFGSCVRQIPLFLRRPHNVHTRAQRHLSSGPIKPPVVSPTSAASQARPTVNASREVSRLQRLNDRLPKFVQRWTTPLLRAPASQVIAFLLLHEATAVIPLFGLVGVMHYTGWMPPYAESTWVIAGVEKFGKYARRKGWLKDADVQAAEGRVVQAQKEEIEDQSEHNGKRTWWQKGSGVVQGTWQKGSGAAKDVWQRRDTFWGRGETGVRLLIEFATAWAVVKALLIPRLALSAWATPWFARLAIEPAMKIMARRGGKLVGGAKKIS